ncbi:hypothetical protein EMIHUDRAFT_209756 [Emiliania huxleyi CCMP1516]|uniref:Nudix hydrolase domain-containing protein n=2 Tax=Emiliania huxleyi TaxID=2903 RepID=A0A0D3J2P8_EMIH1|nr:hypothetical protein EMIHUDRAFT_209756 [Emiliania huxleyi CCMP1516]EOD17783.1 hypothetical protein EMIHUDRAFT_209756 [Emiliania huxleyi CCMP1516]|eukprot:XP_005770212.1 hypothetical protein EMIHUDRAFT_209756 [Emiliania huxleyi CCMP1516]
MLFLAAFVAPALEALLGRGPPAVARAPLHGLAPPRAVAPPHLFATTADSLTFEAASLCASSAGPGTFESPDALEDALRRHGVDTSRWDSGAYKSCRRLWEEVEAGESLLRFAGSTVVRVVNVVKVVIRRPLDDGMRLYEAAQRLPNGRVRTRGLPLSEKLHYQEPLLSAAHRGVAEELGGLGVGSAGAVQVDLSSLRQWREARSSYSYPTLLSHYNLHQLDATVQGLPSGSFQTSEREAAGRLLHLWEWRRQRPETAFNDLTTVLWAM